jgi:hypothetical protein
VDPVADEVVLVAADVDDPVNRAIDQETARMEMN